MRSARLMRISALSSATFLLLANTAGFGQGNDTGPNDNIPGSMTSGQSGGSDATSGGAAGDEPEGAIILWEVPDATVDVEPASVPKGFAISEDGRTELFQQVRDLRNAVVDLASQIREKAPEKRIPDWNSWNETLQKAETEMNAVNLDDKVRVMSAAAWNGSIVEAMGDISATLATLSAIVDRNRAVWGTLGNTVVDSVDDVREATGDVIKAASEAGPGLNLKDWKVRDGIIGPMTPELATMQKRLMEGGGDPFDEARAATVASVLKELAVMTSNLRQTLTLRT